MNILRVLLSRKFRISYSQLGEDIVIAGLLRTDKPITYVDVGANHPMYGNNSFYFHLRGGRGICVDPNSKFIPQFKKFRGRDTFICSAVSDSEQPECFLYEDPSDTDSFVQMDADPQKHQDNSSQKVANLHINEVLKMAGSTDIDLLSLDTETMDMRIIQAIDYKRFNIKFICVETNKSQEESQTIGKVLSQWGFQLKATNPINSIYQNHK